MYIHDTHTQYIKDKFMQVLAQSKIQGLFQPHDFAVAAGGVDAGSSPSPGGLAVPLPKRPQVPDEGPRSLPSRALQPRPLQGTRASQREFRPFALQRLERPRRGLLRDRRQHGGAVAKDAPAERKRKCFGAVQMRRRDVSLTRKGFFRFLLTICVYLLTD